MSINQLERTNRRKLTFRRIVLSQYSDIDSSDLKIIYQNYIFGDNLLSDEYLIELYVNLCGKVPEFK